MKQKLIFLVIAGLLGAIAGLVMQKVMGLDTWFTALIAAIIGGYLGFRLGKE